MLTASKRRTIMIKRHLASTFNSIPDKSFFQFTDANDRKVYVMIDRFMGTYRRRSDNEVLQLPGDYRDHHAYGAIEVFFIPELTENCQRGFQAMVDMSHQINAPSHLYDDLWIHDRRQLAEQCPTAFGWAVRDTGTHLMTTNHVHSLFLTDYLGHRDSSPHRFFLWNGSQLKSATLKQIEDAICREGCETFRKCRNASFHVKNYRPNSEKWQAAIDAELAGKPFTVPLSY